MMYIMMPSITSSDLSISKEVYVTFKKALSAVKLIMLKYSKSPFLPKNKIVDELKLVLRPLSPDQSTYEVSWKVCGVPKVVIPPKNEGLASTKLRMPIYKSMQKPHYDPSLGYTCGLWLMFHYLTGKLPSFIVII